MIRANVSYSRYDTSVEEAYQFVLLAVLYKGFAHLAITNSKIFSCKRFALLIVGELHYCENLSGTSFVCDILRVHHCARCWADSRIYIVGKFCRFPLEHHCVGRDQSTAFDRAMGNYIGPFRRLKYDMILWEFFFLATATKFKQQIQNHKQIQ